MFILFDWYKFSERDFKLRKMEHRPHARVAIPCPSRNHFPCGGNYKELRNFVDPYVAPRDVCANMDLVLGDYLPRGVVVLR